MDHVAQLCRREPEFAKLETRIVILAFESLPAARAWRAEHCPQFELLLDPQRAAYAAYGMQRSLVGTWRPRTLWRYAREILSGRRLRRASGDPAQLGGNVIIDQAGVLRLLHVSREPMDRPRVLDLLEIVQQPVGSSCPGDRG